MIERSGGAGRRAHHWLVGIAGAAGAAILAWLAVRSTPEAAFDIYLVRIAFLGGAVGALVAVTLHRLLGWGLTVPRVLAFAAIAAGLLGPAGMRLFAIEAPIDTDLFEWLQLGLFGGVPFSMLVFGWRGPRETSDRPSPRRSDSR